MNKILLSKFFRLNEFECPCCRRVMLSETLLVRLVSLRETLFRPIIITSGYRCERYNTRVKGHPNSYHMKGLAADIRVINIPLMDLYEIAKQLRFTGIGVYEDLNFLHLDVRPGAYTEWRE